VCVCVCLPVNHPVWILFTHLTRPCRADRAVELNALREQLLDGGLEGTEHFHISKRDKMEDDFLFWRVRHTISRGDLQSRSKSIWLVYCRRLLNELMMNPGEHNRQLPHGLVKTSHNACLRPQAKETWRRYSCDLRSVNTSILKTSASKDAWNKTSWQNQEMNVVLLLVNYVHYVH